MELASDVNKESLITTAEFSNGLTPLLAAYRDRHYPICKVLISHGADYMATSWNGYRIEPTHLSTIFRNVIHQYITPHRPIRILRRRVTITPFEQRMNRIGLASAIAESPVIRYVLPSPAVVLPVNVEKPNFFLTEHMEMLVELKKQCPICFDEYRKDEVVFIKECHHPVCKTCHKQLDKCYFCRK